MTRILWCLLIKTGPANVDLSLVLLFLFYTVSVSWKTSFLVILCFLPVQKNGSKKGVESLQDFSNVHVPS